MLPSERSLRRSKTVPRTADPKWNQTFIYSPLKHAEISYRTLEVSIWHYDRRCGCSLLGFAQIPLAQIDMNDEPRWYPLRHPDDAALDEISREVFIFFSLFHTLLLLSTISLLYIQIFSFCLPIAYSHSHFSSSEIDKFLFCYCRTAIKIHI